MFKTPSKLRWVILVPQVPSFPGAALREVIEVSDTEQPTTRSAIVGVLSIRYIVEHGHGIASRPRFINVGDEEATKTIFIDRPQACQIDPTLKIAIEITFLVVQPFYPDRTCKAGRRGLPKSISLRPPTVSTLRSGDRPLARSLLETGHNRIPARLARRASGWLSL